MELHELQHRCDGRYNLLLVYKFLNSSWTATGPSPTPEPTSAVLLLVGMAGLAISQSFNGIAAGFKGPLMIAGIVVVVIGHALNIVMCFLSVVVHGVRLNVLEFSGQVGLEWTGIAYDPFKEKE